MGVFSGIRYPEEKETGASQMFEQFMLSYIFVLFSKVYSLKIINCFGFWKLICPQ